MFGYHLLVLFALVSGIDLPSLAVMANVPLMSWFIFSIILSIAAKEVKLFHNPLVSAPQSQLATFSWELTIPYEVFIADPKELPVASFTTNVPCVVVSTIDILLALYCARDVLVLAVYFFASAALVIIIGISYLAIILLAMHLVWSGTVLIAFLSCMAFDLVAHTFSRYCTMAWLILCTYSVNQNGLEGLGFVLNIWLASAVTYLRYQAWRDSLDIVEVEKRNHKAFQHRQQQMKWENQLREEEAEKVLLQQEAELLLQKEATARQEQQAKALKEQDTTRAADNEKKDKELIKFLDSRRDSSGPKLVSSWTSPQTRSSMSSPFSFNGKSHSQASGRAVRGPEPYVDSKRLASTGSSSVPSVPLRLKKEDETVPSAEAQSPTISPTISTLAQQKKEDKTVSLAEPHPGAFPILSGPGEKKEEHSTPDQYSVISDAPSGEPQTQAHPLPPHSPTALAASASEHVTGVLPANDAESTIKRGHVKSAEEVSANTSFATSVAATVLASPAPNPVPSQVATDPPSVFFVSVPEVVFAATESLDAANEPLGAVNEPMEALEAVFKTTESLSAIPPSPRTKKASPLTKSAGIHKSMQKRIADGVHQNVVRLFTSSHMVLPGTVANIATIHIPAPPPILTAPPNQPTAPTISTSQSGSPPKQAWSQLYTKKGKVCKPTRKNSEELQTVAERVLSPPSAARGFDGDVSMPDVPDIEPHWSFLGLASSLDAKPNPLATSPEFDIHGDSNMVGSDYNHSVDEDPGLMRVDTNNEDTSITSIEVTETNPAGISMAEMNTMEVDMAPSVAASAAPTVLFSGLASNVTTPPNPMPFNFIGSASNATAAPKTASQGPKIESSFNFNLPFSKGLVFGVPVPAAHSPVQPPSQEISGVGNMDVDSSGTTPGFGHTAVDPSNHRVGPPIDGSDLPDYEESEDGFEDVIVNRKLVTHSQGLLQARTLANMMGSAPTPIQSLPGYDLILPDNTASPSPFSTAQNYPSLPSRLGSFTAENRPSHQGVSTGLSISQIHASSRNAPPGAHGSSTPYPVTKPPGTAYGANQSPSTIKQSAIGGNSLFSGFNSSPSTSVNSGGFMLPGGIPNVVMNNSGGSAFMLDTSHTANARLIGTNDLQFKPKKSSNLVADISLAPPVSPEVRSSVAGPSSASGQLSHVSSFVKLPNGRFRKIAPLESLQLPKTNDSKPKKRDREESDIGYDETTGNRPSKRTNQD
ncbi:hypothetical protein F5Y16DRAFT_419145 [Xylariaceae sp. FL0255]|nr:hypothetical protein F5Y16DRAFT_419145 [Xylariaceae sp. FL0255]